MTLRTDVDGYAEMMDALANPDNWDAPGLIADVAQEMANEDRGHALAVIDTLTFRMRDIANLISHGHAKRISPDTIREAASIAASFVEKP